MGAEARTTLTLGRQEFAGTALLETEEIIFRGETRLRIPLKSISNVAVKSGALHVTHGDGLAILSLGDAVAARWAQKITSPRTLADKLGVKQGMRVAVLGVTDTDIFADVAARGADVVTGKVPEGTAMVLFRVTRASQLAKLQG